MNFTIIIAFLLLIISVLVLVFPKELILKVGYYKRYDMETVPKKYLYTLVIITTIVMITSLAVLMLEGSLLDIISFDELLSFD